MFIRPESRPSGPTLDVLKRCYLFVSREWHRIPREPSQDEGFEQRFRESCLRGLPNWAISGEREMQLGERRETASGVLHEVDIVARHTDATVMCELKNRRGVLPDKNDVIVFFAKILDFLAANPVLMLKDVCLALASSRSFEDSGLAACLGLGIHPIGSDIRPLPILIRNAMIMENEIRQGLQIESSTQGRFEDLCAQLNRLAATLSSTWLDNRCGYHTENTVLLRTVEYIDTMELAHQIRYVNGLCTEILRDLNAAKIG